MKTVPWSKFRKLLRNNMWHAHISRPFTFLMLNLMLLLGLSANAVSWLSILCVIIGCVMLSLFTNPIIVVAGFLIFLLRYVLDDCDGTVARVTKVFSIKGLLIDYFGHAFEMPLFFFSMTMLSYHIIGLDTILIIGFLCSTFIAIKKIIEGLYHSGFIYDIFIHTDKKSYTGRVRQLRAALNNKVDVSRYSKGYDEGKSLKSFIIMLFWEYFTVVSIFLLVFIVQSVTGFVWLLPLALSGYCLFYFLFIVLYIYQTYNDIETRWLFYIEKMKEKIK